LKSFTQAVEPHISDWIEARPGETPMAAGEVHVWRFRLALATGKDETANLTDEERQRAECMVSAEVRNTFVASQSALRALLSGYTGKPARELEFAREEHGKPVLASPPAVEFNVSHSGEWGVMAVATVHVGVDVELVRPQRPTSALARRFLTDGERELVRLRSAQHGEAAFFIAWSRKEAYLKAAGFGLAAPFSRVDSSLERLPDLDESGAQLPGGAPWSVREFFVDERHPAAVVARAARLEPRFLTLHRDES
jgi:4'-phosphopantetheinyl transferase